jgi:hypothetical protein
MGLLLLLHLQSCISLAVCNDDTNISSKIPDQQYQQCASLSSMWAALHLSQTPFTPACLHQVVWRGSSRRQW